jgi:hypothetical protein
MTASQQLDLILAAAPAIVFSGTMPATTTYEATSSMWALRLLPAALAYFPSISLSAV